VLRLRKCRPVPAKVACLKNNELKILACFAVGGQKLFG